MEDEVPKQTNRPPQTIPRYALTRREAAASLGMSVDTFERKVQPVIKVITCGQLVLVPPTEVERWVRDNARHLIARTQVG
jgi:hypothetical protein